MDKEIGEIIQDRINRLEKEKKDLIQKNRTYKGMLQKQNKIIDLMADTIIEDSDNLGTFWCNGCLELSKCPYKDIKQCVREYFEREVK